MKKMLCFFGLLVLACTFSFSDPLNSRTVANCMSLIETFADENDYTNYYQLTVEIISLNGRTHDTNQIITQVTNNRMNIQIYYNDTVYFRIFIEKSSRSYASAGGISFRSSRNLGYTTTYVMNYNIGEAYDMRYIFQEIFSSFDL